MWKRCYSPVRCEQVLNDCEDSLVSAKAIITMTKNQSEQTMPKNRKVMAIASGGGHWVQLCRINPAFEGMDIFYVSIDPSAASDVPGHRYYTVWNASRRDRLKFLVLVFQIIRILLKERPRVVITTGAAPGWLAMTLAKVFLRSKTIWIDSIANAEKLSMSGQKARKVADIWLTQWPELSGPDGPEYWGAVL